MKKVLVIMLFTIIFNVYALEGNISIECEKTTLKPGDSTNCTITGNTTGQVSGVDMKLIVTESLEILDLEKNSSWEMGDVEDNHIALFTSENKSEIFNIATFTLKAKDITEDATESVSLIDVSLSDDNFDEEEKTVEPLEIKIKLNGEEEIIPDETKDGGSKEDKKETKEDEPLVVDVPSTGKKIKYSVLVIFVIVSVISYLKLKKHSKFSK